MFDRGVAAIVGGQFGSEGKGAVAAHLAREYQHHVRVGAANAGHTIYVRGVKHVLQQLPCAAYTNPEAALYVGPGALISPEILEREVASNAAWRAVRRLPPPEVFVDYRAHVITPEHAHREAVTDLSDRIGSTSATAREGIGAAQAARVMREVDCVMAYQRQWPLPIKLIDVPAALAVRDGILLEGTQGAGLSLTTGFFPFVTSRNTTSAGLCADAGIAPTRLERVMLVVRTFPIRVAGRSGPFWPDSQEIVWSDIKGAEAAELTTVTRKVRRVATLSVGQVEEAAMLNGATEIALMFADYVEPGVAGRTDPSCLAGYPELIGIVRELTVDAAPVTLIGTGPDTMLDLRIEERRAA